MTISKAHLASPVYDTHRRLELQAITRSISSTTGSHGDTQVRLSWRVGVSLVWTIVFQLVSMIWGISLRRLMGIHLMEMVVVLVVLALTVALARVICVC